MSGFVGSQTSRSLDLQEFRGFVLVDEKAPIIFINQKDTSFAGKIFTLIHELVHLFINDEEILTEVSAKDYSFNPTEAFVNRVTAEILVPRHALLQSFERLKDKTLDEQSKSLAKQFCVSEFVIVRRLYDLKQISKATFEKKTEQLQQAFEQYIQNTTKEKNEKKKGGNFYNNLKFKTDPKLPRYVEQALLRNRISYTRAFRMMGMGYKSYKFLVGGQ